MRTFALVVTSITSLMGAAALIKVPADVGNTASPAAHPQQAPQLNNMIEHTESRQYMKPQNPYYSLQNPYLSYPVPQIPLPYPIPQPHRPPQPFNPGFGPQNGLMDILDSVAANDELQCVSKILCEMTSGRGQNRNPAQPGFVNLDSILTPSSEDCMDREWNEVCSLKSFTCEGLAKSFLDTKLIRFQIGMVTGVNTDPRILSSVDDQSASPLVKFGKAFVLGYTSRHISSCQYAYPRCPTEPDRLIHYLNNQNGGLFRFFSGVDGFNGVNNLNQQNSIRYPNQRIQNTPNSELLNNILNNNYQFNNENTVQNIRGPRQYSPVWSFPSREQNNGYESAGEEDTRFTFKDHEDNSNFKTETSLKFHEHDYNNNHSPTSTRLTSIPFYFPDSFFIRGAEINVEKDYGTGPIAEENNIVFKDGK